MSLSTGSSKLNRALKDLRLRWDETKAQWNDPVSQAFEDNQTAPLEMQILATLRAIDRLARIIDQVRQECGQESEPYT
jgi:hypothetical protein